PMKGLHVSKEVELLFECGDTGASILLGRSRVELAGAVDADGGHLSDGGIEGRGLAAGGILGVVDTLPRQRLTQQRQRQGGAENSRRNRSSVRHVNSSSLPHAGDHIIATSVLPLRRPSSPQPALP